MNNIGVIGAGIMGQGIAQVFATAGFKTTLLDIDLELLNRALLKIDNNLEKQVEKNKLSYLEKESILTNINLSIDYNSFIKSDLIVEAASENQKIKKKIFKQMDSICNHKTILASNTSSISISKLAEVTNRPDLVIGMHFMNPVPIMKLIEVVKGNKTSQDTLKKVIEVSRLLDKIPIECNDAPGFIANRILMPMINEAIHCFNEGVGSKEAIDEIMKLGMSHPMGPLALADLIGLDICYDILEILYKDFNDIKYKPCELLHKMVLNRKLGRKTGEGFYKY